MRLARAYIQYMDRLNWVIGRCTMYGIFLLMGVLFYSSISKTFFVPSLWTLEMAQFVMVGYYVLGRALFPAAGLKCTNGLALRQLATAQKILV